MANKLQKKNVQVFSLQIFTYPDRERPFDFERERDLESRLFSERDLERESRFNERERDFDLDLERSRRLVI